MREVIGTIMAAGDFLPLAQNAFARWKIIIPDFVGRRHRRISKAQNVGRELVAAVHAERIGLLGKCDNVFLAARKALNHDTRQTILALQPVTFHYKNDNTDTPQFGLIAEDVAKKNPDLVVCDANGNIYTVRYEAVNAMLLNEFLKEHRRVEEQGATIAKQQKQIDALTRGLQKVSDKVELKQPSPQVARDHQ